MTHVAQMELFATPRKLLIEIIGRLFKYRRLYRCQTLHDGKRYSFEQGRSYFKVFLTSYLTFRAMLGISNFAMHVREMSLDKYSARRNYEMIRCTMHHQDSKSERLITWTDPGVQHNAR